MRLNRRWRGGNMHSRPYRLRARHAARRAPAPGGRANCRTARPPAWSAGRRRSSNAWPTDPTRWRSPDQSNRRQPPAASGSANAVAVGVSTAHLSSHSPSTVHRAPAPRGMQLEGAVVEINPHHAARRQQVGIVEKRASSKFHTQLYVCGINGTDSCNMLRRGFSRVIEHTTMYGNMARSRPHTISHHASSPTRSRPANLSDARGHR